MSKRIFSIDKTLYEIFSESPDRGFRLSELRVEYSFRSVEPAMPTNEVAFWQIYMQIEVLKSRKLIRREEHPAGGGILFIERKFWDHPLNIVEGLLAERRI